MMKSEGRLASLNRSFRKSFRRKKPEEVEKAACDLVAEEKKLIEEFRNALSDVLEPRHTECTLRRFLKARNNDVKEAEKLFRLDINYRRLLRAEELMNTATLPAITDAFNITGLLGFDKEGCLVRVVNIGQTDVKGLIHSLSTIELLKVNFFILLQDEKMMLEESKRRGKECYQYTIIINLENMNANHYMYKPVLDTALCSLKLVQDHFHDILKAVYVVNAPAIFSSVYKLLKPVIQDELQKRIKIYSTSDNWKQVLLEHIDADVLPVYFGGTRVDKNNDPKCSEFIGQGGHIDEKYYTKPEQFLDPNDPDVKTVVIPAGSFVNVPIDVQEAGSVIRWHVCAKDNDVGFSVYYEPPYLYYEENGKKSRSKKKEEDKTDLSKLEQLSPTIRSQCHISPEIGIGILWKPGIHLLHLDNTYSWRNPKEVYYKIEFESPNMKISPEDELGESLKRIRLISTAAA